MFEITLQLMAQSPMAVAVVPPMLVALVAARRAIMSRSRNFTGYAAVALTAGVVCQINVVFLNAAPVVALMVTGLAVMLAWMEIRYRADSRRKHRLSNGGARLRTGY